MKRIAPTLATRAGDYWRSGADGKLRICHCQDCGRYMHPPQPLCPKCYGQNVKFDPVSGKGTVFSFTINRYQWQPGAPPPYVIAEVELVEQEGLKLMTNIVNIAPEKVKVGMPVSVLFDHVDDAYIPVFQP
jgi:uncharacterized OB-fold protein